MSLLPRRSIPRPRREVPLAVWLTLRPLFRYSEWRDAWILRGVGRKYGPVLRCAGRAAAARAAPEPSGTGRRYDKLRWPIRVRRRSAVLALSGTLVAAVLGFTIARAIGGRHSLLALDKHASAGFLQVSFPSGWRRQTPPVTPRLGLTDELALAPAAPSGGMLIIGRTVTADPTLMPPSLLATLPYPPTAQIVTLGRATFFRYLNLSPRGPDMSESVYALPTTVGTILGVCLTREPRPSFTSSCERLLGTMKLSSGKVAIGLSASYAAALKAVISKLNAARSSAGLQLSGARDAHGQATAATKLASAHAEAASALLRLDAGPARVANSAVAAALRMTSNAYGALSRAAAGTDARRYSTARTSLTLATNALNSAYAELRSLGYRVG